MVKRKKSKSTKIKKVKKLVNKKKGTRRKQASNQIQRIYNKTEKSIGASRIVERISNLVGFPPEPYRSVITTGVGFARGGVPGGLGALLVSSNIIEMAMDQFSGTSQISNNGQVTGL